MTQIMPQHVAYPRTFTSRQVYISGDHKNWRLFASESDTPLNDQLRQFVDKTGHVITQVSPPQVTVYQETPAKRIFITGVSVIYIPSAEGEDDQPREVDAHRS